MSFFHFIAVGDLEQVKAIHRKTPQNLIAACDYAIAHQRIEIIKWLIAEGVLKVHWTYNPVFTCLKYQRYEIAELFALHGVRCWHGIPFTEEAIWRLWRSQKVPREVFNQNTFIKYTNGRREMGMGRFDRFIDNSDRQSLIEAAHTTLLKSTSLPNDIVKLVIDLL
jgi:hypothetical protein